MTKSDSSGRSGAKFLLLAFLSFSGLGLELLLAFGVEPSFYGAQMSEWTSAQNIIHWILTCVVWMIVAGALIVYARRRADFDVLSRGGAVSKMRWGVAVACVIVMLIISYFDWKGFKVVKEYRFHGALRFSFQYLYYLMETVLVYLVIAFSQKAGELWFKNPRVPYGGIFTAITWGMVHTFTKGDLRTGLISALGSVIMGGIYLLLRKDARKAFPLILIAFVF